MSMTDRLVAKLSREYKQAQTDESDAKARKLKIAKRVIPELDRRGTKSLESNGVKTTRTAQTIVKYDWDALAERLTTRQLRSIQKREVDKELLAEAVQSGKIDRVVVEQCSEVIETSAYLTISLQS